MIAMLTISGLASIALMENAISLEFHLRSYEAT